jgi:CO dehydrogenase maturation factor
MIKTAPPGAGSRLLTVTEQNPIFDHFAQTYNGIRVMAAGPYAEDDLGVKCYHSKTGAIELFLNHLIDGEREYVVTDMTAGTDSFASGLFTRFDVTFIIVEPTLKSLGVYQQYKGYAEDYGVTLASMEQAQAEIAAIAAQWCRVESFSPEYCDPRRIVLARVCD